MLHACILDFLESWDMKLLLEEFTYNNNYHVSIRMAPYKALYGRKCKSPMHWDEVGEMSLIGPELVQHTAQMVEKIRETMKISQDGQKSYTNRRRKDLEFTVGDHVFLRNSPLKGIIRFGKGGKLSLWYIGPFDIIERIRDRAY